jgi:hypothetical protein
MSDWTNFLALWFRRRRIFPARRSHQKPQQQQSFLVSRRHFVLTSNKAQRRRRFKTINIPKEDKSLFCDLGIEARLLWGSPRVVHEDSHGAPGLACRGQGNGKTAVKQGKMERFTPSVLLSFCLRHDNHSLSCCLLPVRASSWKEGFGRNE